MKAHSNSTDPMRMAKLIGWVVVSLIMYAAVSGIVLLVSMLLLQRGIAPDLPWITSVQTHLYSSGGRRIWQAQVDCVAFDEDLIYKPKDGKCQFDNVEFKTVLNFSREGRYTGVKPEGPGIAVIGDSHAMGWGVGDEETFAAEIQKTSKRPVYNLAVSSYGTARELIRLEKSGLLAKVDTIIIQYCDNDLLENRQFQPAASQDNQEKFATITHATEQKSADTFSQLKKGYAFTFRAPFSSLRKWFVPRVPENFSGHYQPLIDVLSRHPTVATKRIIVFYSNGQGKKFRSFPVGKDQLLTNVEFADLGLVRDDYYRIDDHLTPAGHQKVAQRLLDLIRH
jgi:lysophospholipase L1-like esterase